MPRRLSAGAQYAGRGGAGNVFKGEDELEQLARNRSVEQAIDETPENAAKEAAKEASEKTSERTDKIEKVEPAATIKKWLFGKRP